MSTQAAQTPQPPQPPQAPAAAARGRGRKTALDMLRSVAAIGAAVAVVFLLVPRPETRVVQPVEVEVTSTGLQSESTFELVVPQVPDSWTATSVRYRPDSADAVPTWHIGYLTADEQYAGLEVADEATQRWLDEQTSTVDERALAQESAEEVEVGGEGWTLLRSTDPVRTSLVLEQGALTTVVTGSADVDELTVLAEAVLAARS